MLFPDRTTDGKVALSHRATGERLVRWPVDARDLLASGQYAIAAPTTAAEAPAEAPADASPDPVPHVTAALRENAGMTPIGAPLVVDTRSTAGPALPMTLPAPGQRTSRGKR